MRYYRIGREEYPSVTTVLSIIAKPQLLEWAKREVARRAVEELDKLIDMSPSCALQYLVSAPAQEAEEAALRGKQVHAVLEATFKGGDVRVGAKAKPYLKGLQMFLEETRPEVLRSEALCYSKRGYAGTLDMLAIVDGRLAVVDLKTSKRIYPDYWLQVAAYRHADYLVAEETVPMPPVELSCVVLVGPDGYELGKVEDDSEDFEAFLAALTLYKRLRGEN